MSKLTQKIVVKLGGAVLEDTSSFESICQDLVEAQKAGFSMTLIHGGGSQINRELNLHGIQWSFHEGMRVTTKEMMEQIEKVLCGQINKRVVRTLTRFGLRAAGISGLDCQTLMCRQLNPQLGQVGEIEKVDLTLLEGLYKASQKTGGPILPVIAPVGVGVNGESYNVNADWAAVKVAVAIKARKVLFMTDQPGVLDASGAPISELNPQRLNALIQEGTIRGGMLAKVRSILFALESGVPEVHVLNGKKSGSIHSVLLQRLRSGVAGGTRCSSGGVLPEEKPVRRRVELLINSNLNPNLSSMLGSRKYA